MERELSLRIIVLRPPRGVHFALQRGRSELVEPVRADEEVLVFDFEVRVGERPDGAPNFLGPFAQGTPCGTASSTSVPASARGRRTPTGTGGPRCRSPRSPGS